MDSITHIALGACMGEAFAGKQLGKKAMLWGALAQSAADIDFVTSIWMDTEDALLAHRGFTHSIVFCFLATAIMAFAAEKFHRKHLIGYTKWTLFFGSVIFIHIFLDAFNNYGVGWFEPFTHARISFNTIYVADPFFSIWPAITLVVLLVIRRRSKARAFFWKSGLIVPALYLCYCIFNKVQVDRDVRTILKSQQISYTRYFTTPAPLQNWLWFVVAGNDSGYHVGYRSVFDKEKKIDFQYFPVKEHLLQEGKEFSEVLQLKRFSQDFYTVEKWGDSLIFNDLRFGQIMGWEDPKGRFAFHYILEPPADNTLVVQRGRFAGWSRKGFAKFWKRVRGEKSIVDSPGQ